MEQAKPTDSSDVTLPWYGFACSSRGDVCSGDCTGAELDGVQLARWMGLSQAGVGAAGVAIFPLSALHYAGDLQTRHH